jgi:hypothetical protein
MFFKSNPRKKLQKRYEAAMAEAMELQRSGKIPEFAKKTAEAEAILKELEALPSP